MHRPVHAVGGTRGGDGIERHARGAIADRVNVHLNSRAIERDEHRLENVGRDDETGCDHALGHDHFALRALAY
jgi:hypothetical protein